MMNKPDRTSAIGALLAIGALMLAVCIISPWTGPALAQDAPAVTTAQTNNPAAPTELEQYAEQQNAAYTPTVPRDQYGLWVLTPPVVAIVIAILTRQVVVSLFIATMTGAFMLLPCLGASASFGGSNVVIRGVRLTMERYITGAIADTNHIQVILFTLMIGGMVGIVTATGGMRAMVDVICRWSKTSRRAQLTGWFGGWVVFFDDYANTMILGPTLRPLFDRLRISRAKLAYIVDSTAAPVASLVPIGTWIGAEIGYIRDGLNSVREAAAATGTPVPEVIAGANEFHIFVASIGYRFYVMFALVLVFFVALTQRDFGPMRKAERDALTTPPDDIDTGAADQPVGRAWYALLPVLMMVGVTVAILIIPGLESFKGKWTWSLDAAKQVLENADPYGSILYGALAGLGCALLIAAVSRTIRLEKAAESGLDGMARMFPAVVILVLAWALSDVTQKLEVGSVVSARLQASNFEPIFLPMAIFGAACLVSFSTGSSWGTMAILCPAAVEIGARLCADLPIEQASPLFYSAVGAVLAGAIFGDHCSPISDTTVLSSIATSCKIETHVWTQMPYAVLAGVVSVAAGNYVCNVMNKPWWMALGIGTAAMLLFILIVGRTPPHMPRTPVPVRQTADAGTPMPRP